MSLVLITGGLGFVGGRLAKKIAKDSDVMVSSRKKNPTELLALHGEIVQVDHNDLLSKGTFPKDVETVIHLAALNEWDCVQHPSEAIRVNIDETRIILENSIARGVQNFIFFSTAHIYGSPLQGTITENTLPVPVHPYAITHKAAEDYVLAAARQQKIHSIIIRLSNSFGAPVSPRVNRWTLLANDLSKQAIEKGKLTLLSNGCQYRDFIGLTDVENVITAMIQRGPLNFKKQFYNLGSGRALRVIDIATKIADVHASLFGKKITIEMPDGTVASEEPVLNYTIERLLAEDLSVKNNFDEELKDLLIFCSKNFKRRD
jgi:UDP-glucose 4-epimerase